MPVTNGLARSCFSSRKTKPEKLPAPSGSLSLVSAGLFQVSLKIKTPPKREKEEWLLLHVVGKTARTHITCIHGRERRPFQTGNQRQVSSRVSLQRDGKIPAFLSPSLDREEPDGRCVGAASFSHSLFFVQLRSSCLLTFPPKGPIFYSSLRHGEEEEEKQGTWNPHTKKKTGCCSNEMGSRQVP